MNAQKNLDRIVGELEASTDVIKRVAAVSQQVSGLQEQNIENQKNISVLMGDIERRLTFLSETEAQEAQRLLAIARETKSSATLLSEQIQSSSLVISHQVESVKQAADMIHSAHQEVIKSFENGVSSLKKELISLASEMRELNEQNAKKQSLNIFFSVLILAGIALLFYLK